MKTTLNVIEERGIDVASFWDGLYYERMPQGYEEEQVWQPHRIAHPRGF
jgi:starch synthase